MRQPQKEIIQADNIFLRDESACDQHDSHQLPTQPPRYDACMQSSSHQSLHDLQSSNDD